MGICLAEKTKVCGFARLSKKIIPIEGGVAIFWPPPVFKSPLNRVHIQVVPMEAAAVPMEAAEEEEPLEAVLEGAAEETVEEVPAQEETAEEAPAQEGAAEETAEVKKDKATIRLSGPNCPPLEG